MASGGGSQRVGSADKKKEEEVAAPRVSVVGEGDEEEGEKVE
jgi:hypothetical protein